MATPVNCVISASVLPAGRLIRPPDPELTFQAALSAVAVSFASVCRPHQNLWLALFAAITIAFAETLVAAPILVLTTLWSRWLVVAPLAPARDADVLSTFAL